MKLSSKIRNSKMFLRRLAGEDYRYLQKKISGNSVYRNVKHTYRRSPKHRSRWNEYLYQ